MVDDDPWFPLKVLLLLVVPMILDVLVVMLLQAATALEPGATYTLGHTSWGLAFLALSVSLFLRWPHKLDPNWVIPAFMIVSASVATIAVVVLKEVTHTDRTLLPTLGLVIMAVVFVLLCLGSALWGDLRR